MLRQPVGKWLGRVLDGAHENAKIAEIRLFKLALSGYTFLFKHILYNFGNSVGLGLKNCSFVLFIKVYNVDLHIVHVSLGEFRRGV